MIRRIALPVFGLACFSSLLLACFRTVLFEDGQFAHFDAAFFYYPLYQRVQQEWAAGRWPLWDPGQNGGTPLLAIPMAAVLYPGKVVYALLPYAWAARLYVIVHTCIAFLGVLALARSCGVSGVGSILSGLSYAFGAPVLLLYGNVILLVGAAWLPWGLRAIDRLLRQRPAAGHGRAGRGPGAPGTRGRPGGRVPDGRRRRGLCRRAGPARGGRGLPGSPSGCWRSRRRASGCWVRWCWPTPGPRSRPRGSPGRWVPAFGGLDGPRSGDPGTLAAAPRHGPAGAVAGPTGLRLGPGTAH